MLQPVGGPLPEMFASAILYCGLAVAAVGLIAVIRPIRRLRLRTRRERSGLVLAGLVLAVTALVLPASESRIARPVTRLDEFVPAWQFREFHTIEVRASPERVFDAIKLVRADEILFFRALTWIRRGGQSLPPGILNAGQLESLIEVALNGGFVRLAEDVPRELVIGTVVMAPPGTRGTLMPSDFRRRLPPGFALAAMNFRVTETVPGHSLVSTETRIFANSPSARRRFARYWRLIYPGSAIIRRMWLRAVKRRATTRG